MDKIKELHERNEERGSLILKAFQSVNSLSFLEKSRSGVYSDNPVNQKLKRVGQKYGSKKQEEPVQEKDKKQETEQPKKKKSLEEHAQRHHG